VGGVEIDLVGSKEPTVRYHSDKARILTLTREPGEGQFQVGSLTGAVASKMVTEAYKGSLRLVGNQPQSVKAEGSLTARPTSRAGWKHGLSDPTALRGRAVAQRIKVTLGITG
jgi:Family of unknown function (DUF6467)